MGSTLGFFCLFRPDFSKDGIYGEDHRKGQQPVGLDGLSICTKFQRACNKSSTLEFGKVQIQQLPGHSHSACKLADVQVLLRQGLEDSQPRRAGQGSQLLGKRLRSSRC